MTPALYRRAGLEQRIGPLIEIAGRGAQRLLIVRNVTVDRFGRRGRARRMPTRGGLRGNSEARDMIVAFIGIPATSRVATVAPSAILAAHAARLPDLVGEELRREMGNASR